MADLRMRSKTSLNPRNDGFKTRNSEDSTRVLSAAVLACGSFAARNWLFERGIGSVWLTERVLFCAGIGVAVKLFLNAKWNARRIEWSLLGLSSFLNFVRILSFCAALPRIGTLRLLIFAFLTPTWIQSIVTLSSTRAVAATGLGIAISALSDAKWVTHQLHTPAPAYGFLILYGLATWAHEHTTHALAPALGGAAGAGGASMIGALLCAIPAHFIAVGLGAVHPTPALPVATLLAIPILAAAFFLYSSLSPGKPPRAGLPLLIAFFMGPILFRSTPAWADLTVAGLMTYGASRTRSTSLTEIKSQPTSRLLRSYLKTILENPESRKIFYFLMLNMCYMLVQMLYGIWTNSLGLISDAIHMAFDCMAIGVGLFASVMATWPANERFTYGYGRIETLSGFANGVFLILISIFIIFEAIQRLLDPPEMNTNQLLLVSGLGLGVNLFGMFAMGGHHHGHSHGGHSHGHSHGGGSSHSHSHSHGHDDHDHGHSHGRRESAPQVLINGFSGVNGHDAHGHGHGHEGHSHDAHGHDDCEDHSHGHDHSHSGDHGHSHDEDHGHSHNSNHDHSHGGGHDHLHNGDHGHSHDDHGHSHNGSHAITPLHVPPRNSTSSPGPLLSPTLPFLPANMRSGPMENHHADHAHRSSSLPPAASSYSYYSNAQEEHEQTTSGAHNHDHGQSHNMRGVFLHVMADTLGSVGVIISTLLIQWYGWTGFDPIASLFIAILIAASVVPLVIDCAKVLSLDVGERETSIRQALIELSNVDGLASYSAPRFWPKDGESLVGSIHIQLAPSASSYDPAGAHRAQHTTYVNAERVVDRVEQLLRARIHGLDGLSIQVEGSRDQPWCS